MEWPCVASAAQPNVCTASFRIFASRSLTTQFVSTARQPTRVFRGVLAYKGQCTTFGEAGTPKSPQCSAPSYSSPPSSSLRSSVPLTLQSVLTPTRTFTIPVRLVVFDRQRMLTMSAVSVRTVEGLETVARSASPAALARTYEERCCAICHPNGECDCCGKVHVSFGLVAVHRAHTLA
jgi:hypothetical protein